jgi:hypothetical protein
MQRKERSLFFFFKFVINHADMLAATQVGALAPLWDFGFL